MPAVVKQSRDEKIFTYYTDALRHVIGFMLWYSVLYMLDGHLWFVVPKMWNCCGFVLGIVSGWALFEWRVQAPWRHRQLMMKADEHFMLVHCARVEVGYVEGCREKSLLD